MDQSEDRRELERKIETASRIAKTITDQTTIERLRGWVEELRQACSNIRPRGGPMKRSRPALENSGSKTVAPPTATWSSGFKPNLK